MKTSEQCWDDFVASLDQALDRAIESGEPKRLSIGINNRHITIDIYESKAQMKVFEEAILKIAKNHWGLEVVK